MAEIQDDQSSYDSDATDEYDCDSSDVVWRESDVAAILDCPLLVSAGLLMEYRIV